MSIGTAAAPRADFYIWSYGPMSNVLESEDFDLVQGELGLEIRYVGPAPQLPRPVAARLSDMAAAGSPGNWSGAKSATGLGHPREEVGLYGGEACRLPLRGGVQPRAEGVAWVTVCGSRRVDDLSLYARSA